MKFQVLKTFVEPYEPTTYRKVGEFNSMEEAIKAAKEAEKEEENSKEEDLFGVFYGCEIKLTDWR